MSKKLEILKCIEVTSQRQADNGTILRNSIGQLRAEYAEAGI